VYYSLLLTDICPFCDEILPNPMSYKMKLVLDQLNNDQGNWNCIMYYSNYHCFINN
jgi:hypothetical protein